MSNGERLAYITIALSGLLILMTCRDQQDPPPMHPADNFYETMNLEQIEEQLKDIPGNNWDRIFTIVGLEVEGTYWWSCNGEWTKIDPPCVEHK